MGDTGTGEPQSRPRAVLVAPVADAARFADLCAALRIEAEVVPAPGAGVAAVLGPDADAATSVQAVSRLLRRAEVLLLSKAEGHVQAQRWRGGALQDEIPPALLLSGLPEVVEHLLLRDTSPVDVDGYVSTVGLPARGALGALWRLVRTRRRHP